MPPTDRPKGRTDTMIRWLADAVTQLRRNADPEVKQVQVAAAAGVDQSTIWRFEEEARWPNNVELIVAAYAEECGVEDPRDVWALAIDLWRAHGDPPSVQSLSGRTAAPAAAASSTSAIDAARQAVEKAISGQARARRRGSSSR